MLAGRVTATAGMIVCVAVTLLAQWRVTTKGVPRTPDGKPNYGAPAPKMADGTTPDFSGIWDVERRPCVEATSPAGGWQFTGSRREGTERHQRSRESY